LKVKPFENVRDQIGYCGIWCGSCVAGNGALKELTKRYEDIIINYDLEEWAPKSFDFKEFKKGLVSLQAMPQCPGCLKGGGRDNCEMKACTLSKNINDCSECAQPEECKNLEELQKMRTGALKAGLFVKTEDVDQKEFIQKCMNMMKSKWPSCILFLSD
jgi:hypothetical protein